MLSAHLAPCVNWLVPVCRVLTSSSSKTAGLSADQRRPHCNDCGTTRWIHLRAMATRFAGEASRQAIGGKVAPRPRERRSLDDAEKRTEKWQCSRAISKTCTTGRFLCRKERWCVARVGNGTRIIVMQIRELSARRAIGRTSLLLLRDCHGTIAISARNSCRKNGCAVPERWKSGSIRKTIVNFSLLSALGEVTAVYVHRTYDWRSGEFVRGNAIRENSHERKNRCRHRAAQAKSRRNGGNNRDGIS